MPFRAAHDRLDAGDQLAPVERFCQKIVGPEPETLQLVIEFGQTGKDQDRRTHPRGAQPAQHLVPVDVRQHQIENDDVVIVKLADLEPVLAEIGGVADEPLLLQHQLDAGGGCGIILNQQNTHYGTSPRAMSGACQAAVLSAKIGNRGQPEIHPGY